MRARVFVRTTTSMREPKPLRTYPIFDEQRRTVPQEALQGCALLLCNMDFGDIRVSRCISVRVPYDHEYAKSIRAVYDVDATGHVLFTRQLPMALVCFLRLGRVDN